MLQNECLCSLMSSSDHNVMAEVIKKAYLRQPHTIEGILWHKYTHTAEKLHSLSPARSVDDSCTSYLEQEIPD